MDFKIKYQITFYKTIQNAPGQSFDWLMGNLLYINIWSKLRYVYAIIFDEKSMTKVAFGDGEN